MVNYKFESVQMLKSSVSELEVEQKLADIRMQLSEASLEMKSIDAALDSVTLALAVIHNYRGQDDQIIDLINCGGAMERLLGVAEKDITVAASEEGLGDALTYIWKKIKQFIAWLIQKIKDFGVWIGKKIGLVKNKVENTKKEFEELPKDKKDAIEEACKKITVETGKPCTLTAQQIREQLTGAFGGIEPDSKGTLRIVASFAMEDFKLDQYELFTPKYFFSYDMAENIVSDLEKMKSAIIVKMLRKSPFGPASPEKVISALSSEGTDYLKQVGIKEDIVDLVSHPDTRAKLLDDILKEVNSATTVLCLRRSEGESLSLVLNFKDGKKPKYIKETMYNLGYRSVAAITSMLDKLSKSLVSFKEFESSRDMLIGQLERIERGVTKNADTNNMARSATGFVRGAVELYRTHSNAVIRVENDGIYVANELSETLSSLLAVHRRTTGE